MYAVLYPDSPAWWQYLDSLGINGDLLLPPFIRDDKWQRSILQAKGLQEDGISGRGAHWKAARQLLSGFHRMADTNCPLFARKFAADDAQNIAALAKDFTDPKLVLARIGANSTNQSSV